MLEVIGLGPVAQDAVARRGNPQPSLGVGEEMVEIVAADRVGALGGHIVAHAASLEVVAVGSFALGGHP